MNDDEKKPDLQTWIEPELEARIVAWVSGEASAFEVAELERLTREKPELAIFKRRIEAVRGLVAEAVSPEKEPLRLSPEARARLLKAIGGTEPAAASAPPAVPSLAVFIQRHRTARRWMLAVAACLVGGLFLSMLIPSFQKVRTSASYEKSERVSSNTAAFDQETETFEEGKAPAQPKREKAISGLAGVARNFGALAVPPRDRNKEMAVQLPARSGKADFGLGAPGEITLSAAPTSHAEGLRPAPELASDLKPDAASVTALSKESLQQAGAANSSGLNLKAAEAGAEEASLAAQTVGGQVVDSFSAPAAPAAGGAGQNQQPILEDAGPLQVLAAPAVAQQPAPPNADAPEQQAANAPAGAQDEVTALSPFAVEKDKGSYRANSTLAGTRVRTDLDDVASSASAVTGQFLQDAGEEDAKKVAAKRASAAAGADAEVSASREPVSTFSLHVSDVSFRLAQDALARGEVPDPARIRPEEFYNAFDYGDPAPAMSEKVSCRIEQAADPVRQQRNLVRIALRVPATGHGADQPLRLTVLLDTSGSMEREDRAAAVHRAVQVLASLLGPGDRVTLVGFSRQPRLLAEQLPGDRAGQLLDIIARTPAEGGTNLEEALRLGGELARRQFVAAAQNRIVLLTDGAANLGNADPAQLAASIATLRQQGISFDACGVGIDGINDEILEALTRKGAGRYYVVDTPESAEGGFARQLAGAFHPAALNVKVQVRFNPARVGNYRLIGFEQHRLNEEDFRNDRVEAAALAGGEAAVALYEVQALPQGEGELGEVYVRFRDAATGGMVERSWTLPYDPSAPAFDRATPTMQLAGTAALMAEKLRGGATGDAIRLDQLAPVVNALRGRYAHEARVQALVTMFDQMRRLEKP